MQATARRLWALDAPMLTINAGDLVIGAEGKVTFPLPAFLIEHDRGLILFDTSFHPLAVDDPRAYFGDTLEILNVQSSPEMRIDRQLGKLGFRVEDVTHVILSHGHSDHSGGLFMFPQAKFYIGPGEFAYAANPPEKSAKYFRFAEEIEPVMGFDWTTVTSPIHDLFGDGSITIMHTPGHTPGELTLVVALPSQTMVLTADTVHLREGLDRLSPDPHDWDFDLAIEGLKTLQGLKNDGATLWIAHDPQDWAQFQPLVAQE